MVRCALAALAAVVLVGASLVPEDASARRGGAAATGGVEAFTAAVAGRVGVAGRGYAGGPWICRPRIWISRISDIR